MDMSLLSRSFISVGGDRLHKEPNKQDNLRFSEVKKTNSFMY